MDLIFFDLDGTLLNSESQISNYTRETLALLKQNGIAYTAVSYTHLTLPTSDLV